MQQKHSRECFTNRTRKTCKRFSSQQQSHQKQSTKTHRRDKNLTKKRNTKRQPRDNSNPPPTQRNCTNLKPYVKEGFHNPNNFNSATIKVVFFFSPQFCEIEKLTKLCRLSNLHEKLFFPNFSIFFCERNNKFCQKTKTRATILPNCEKTHPTSPKTKKKQKDPQISRSPTRKNCLQL